MKPAAAMWVAALVVFGLLAAGADAVRSPAQAQSAQQALCDRLAADPADPDKPPDVKGVVRIESADIPTAIKFCKSASASSRRALYQLGRAYAAGAQMPPAVAAYRKAAEKGSTAAMVELAILLATGNGVAKNADEARKLLTRAAQSGNPAAAVKLTALATGDAGASDPAQARALLAQAAEANSAEAQFQLAMMMAEGVGGPKDEVAARAWLERAAAQGHPDALDWMGSFAENGRGGPKDEAAAKAYYEKAAALGNEDAKAALERIKCPYILKDKRGNVMTHLCF